MDTMENERQVGSANTEHLHLVHQCFITAAAQGVYIHPTLAVNTHPILAVNTRLWLAVNTRLWLAVKHRLW